MPLCIPIYKQYYFLRFRCSMYGSYSFIYIGSNAPTFVGCRQPLPRFVSTKPSRRVTSTRNSSFFPKFCGRNSICKKKRAYTKNKFRLNPSIFYNFMALGSVPVNSPGFPVHCFLNLLPASRRQKQCLPGPEKSPGAEKIFSYP